jgi:release factor glutamine methyltransferase
MTYAINKPASFLRGHPEYLLTEQEASFFEELVGRRCSREPFQHIVEQQEFYGFDFLVNKDVLVPRPETELLVETALQICGNMPNVEILEIGTGSGCISVSLRKHLVSAKLLATDISEAALRVARLNAKSNLVDIEFIESDLFSRVPEKEFDLIISNPPYIPSADIQNLEPEVRNFDPLNALTDGVDGLSIIKRIAAGAKDFLKPGGHLMFEFGYGQSDDVVTILKSESWQVVELREDLRSIPRIVVAKVLGQHV